MARTPKYTPGYLFTGSLFPDLPVHPSIDRAARNMAPAEPPLESVRREAKRRDDKIRFISFGSGSSGNSSYIGDSECGIIIDAGVEGRVVENVLRENGISIDKVKGILVTHDHGDHIRYLYNIVRYHPHIGVYCTPRTFNGIMRRHSVSRRLRDFHRPIYKEIMFQLGSFEITAFDVSHDGSDNCGYFISRPASGRRFAIATDLGCITPRVEYYLSQAQHIVLEANYDAGLLAVGPYPEHLKARIKAPSGHLDNAVTARFLASIATPELSHVWLCHLSNDNNTPQIALDTVGAALRDFPDLSLAVLPRFDPSPLYLL